MPRLVGFRLEGNPKPDTAERPCRVGCHWWDSSVPTTTTDEDQVSMEEFLQKGASNLAKSWALLRNYPKLR